MRTLEPSRYADVLDADLAEIGRLCLARLDAAIATCPDWTGADLLAHVAAFRRWLSGLVAGQHGLEAPLPVVGTAEAVDAWAAEQEALSELMRGIDPDATLPNWSVEPDVGAFWVRRTAHDVAVHRFDAATTEPGEPAPMPADVARDGIEEYVDAFVDTAVAAGVPQAQNAATLRFDLTDADAVVERHIRSPGPVTVLRGTASDLLLGLWHRRDPSTYVVDGDRALIAAWPHI